jgi:hypothetical protein
MTVAAVEICESNTDLETVTHGISNINYGVADEPNTDYANHPIPVPGNSMRKEIRLHVTAMNDSNKIDNIRIWKSAGAYLTDEGIQTNLKTSAYSATAYVTPSTTTYTDQTMPTAEPGSANLGIAGSLTGSLTAAGYSDYWHSQLQSTGTGTPPGNANQKTFSIKYDEQ